MILVSATLTLALVGWPVSGQERRHWLDTRVPEALGEIYSVGGAAINKRLSNGLHPIWAGDLVETRADASAAITMDSLGVVLIDPDSAVRISAATAGAERNHELIAALTGGAIEVRLAGDATAHVECNGFVVRGMEGSSFRVRMTAGRPLIDCLKGRVDVESQLIERRLVTTFVSAGPELRRVIGPVSGRDYFKIKTRRTATIRVKTIIEQLRRTARALVPAGTSSPVTQDQQVAEGRIVKFSLRDPSLGSFDQDTKIADSNGECEVTFTSRAKGQTEIYAQAIDLKQGETPQPWTAEMTIEAWPWQRTVLIGSIAAAAVLISACCHSDRGPLRKQDPPVIFPPP